MTTAIQTTDLTLPAYWASYLVNGDASGLSEDDRWAIDRHLARFDLTAGQCLTCDEGERFQWSHDGFGGGAMVLEFTFAR